MPSGEKVTYADIVYTASPGCTLLLASRLFTALDITADKQRVAEGLEDISVTVRLGNGEKVRYTLWSSIPMLTVDYRRRRWGVILYCLHPPSPFTRCESSQATLAFPATHVASKLAGRIFAVFSTSERSGGEERVHVLDPAGGLTGNQACCSVTPSSFQRVAVSSVLAPRLLRVQCSDCLVANDATIASVTQRLLGLRGLRVDPEVLDAMAEIVSRRSPTCEDIREIL